MGALGFLLPVSRGNLFAVPIAVSSTLVGGLVAARRPEHPVGWRFAAFGFVASLNWTTTLRNLAARAGADEAEVVITRTLVDPRRQWRHARNVLQNSAIRTVAYKVEASHPAFQEGLKESSRPSVFPVEDHGPEGEDDECKTKPRRARADGGAGGLRRRAGC